MKIVFQGFGKKNQRNMLIKSCKILARPSMKFKLRCDTSQNRERSLSYQLTIMLMPLSAQRKGTSDNKTIFLIRP